LVGSVKTNLGHSEVVNGIYSVIKVVLALEKRLIPPTIGINNINPALRLSESNVTVVRASNPWPSRDYLRASINSFVHGWANSHIILKSAQSYFKNPNMDLPELQKIYLLPFSAHNERCVTARVQLLAAMPQKINLRNLASTLGC
jgi:acyl transferase domain-containing protein